MSTYKTLGLGEPATVNLGNIDINLPELKELVEKIPNFSPRIEVQASPVEVAAPVINYSAPAITFAPRVEPAAVTVEAPSVKVEAARLTNNFHPKINVEGPYKTLLCAIIVALYLIAGLMAIQLADELIPKYFMLK